MPLTKACCVLDVSLDHALEDKRLDEVGHVLRNELYFRQVESLSVLLCEPHATLRVPDWLAARFLFDLCQDSYKLLKKLIVI